MDFLLRLADPWAYVVIGGLALAEAAAFVGLVAPGETAMILGGVLVFQGRVDLSWMLVAGIAGAIAGDSIGYEIGRHFGPRLRRTRVGRWVGQERWDRAYRYLRERGGRAIFLGRFVGILRALVPAVAGDARIPYRRFLVFNAAGGIIWVGGFISLGVAAGRSWELVEDVAGRAALALAVILALAAAVALGARWAARHADDLRRWGEALLERPTIRRLRRRFRPQIDFVKRRLDPRQRFGLYVTLGFLLAVAAGWAFGALLIDVLAGDELALVDKPVARFFLRHRTEGFTAFMKGVTALGSARVVLPAAAVAGAVAYWRTRELRWPVFLLLAAVGGVYLDDLVKSLVDRPRPALAPLVQASGASFPSGHATAAAALFATLARLLSRGRRVGTAVWLWAAAVFVAALVALSRLYLGVHWLTDALAGLTLGGFWTAVTGTATSAIGRGAEQR